LSGWQASALFTIYWACQLRVKGHIDPQLETDRFS
jgi:hypothetical protein